MLSSKTLLLHPTRRLQAIPTITPNSCTAHSPSLQRKNLGIHRRFLSHYDEVTRQPVPNDQYALCRSATIAGSSSWRSSLLYNFHQGRGAGSTGGSKFQIASALQSQVLTD